MDRITDNWKGIFSYLVKGLRTSKLELYCYLLHKSTAFSSIEIAPILHPAYHPKFIDNLLDHTFEKIDLLIKPQLDRSIETRSPLLPDHSPNNCQGSCWLS